MQPLSAVSLLEVWERGRAATPAARALALLAAACPELPFDAVAALPVGERDLRLLTLRAWAFGATAQALAECPACAERVEVACPTASLPAAAPAQPIFAVTFDDVRYDVRVPSAGDLVMAAGVGDRETARRLVLERCLMGLAPAALPPGALDAIVTGMAQHDPGAVIELALECPACGHGWSAAFEVAQFFWQEIESWARRLLREVHALASAYGWTEAETLALTPWRRQQYLEMADRWATS